MTSTEAGWPELDYGAWQDSCATLHLWTQIVGKIRLAHAPLVNHWWQVPLYVTARGLTTSATPRGARTFQIDFDFIDHRLHIAVSDGSHANIPLVPCSVADFYGEVMARLRALDLETHLWTTPVEIADPIPFEEDRVHAAYDLVMVNRFSGRRAPPPPSNPNIPDFINREAYSHEVSSCGFWPGNGGFGRAAFYSYAYPQPAGFAEAAISPPAAFYNRDFGEFVLPYDAVREAPRPRELLLEFLESTYAAAAGLGKWDRALLERAPA